MPFFPSRRWRSNRVPRELPPPGPPPVAVSYDLLDTLQFQTDMNMVLTFQDTLSKTLEFQTDVAFVARFQF